MLVPIVAPGLFLGRRSWASALMPVPIVPCPDCSARLFTVQCSAFRIEMELERVLPALVDVETVAASEHGYIVTLTIFDSIPIADIIRLVQLNSPLIGTMALIDERTSAGSRIRVAQMKVRPRP